MHRVKILALLLMLPFLGMSQALSPKHVVKTNILGLAVSSVNLNYEYKINDQFSAGIVSGFILPSTRELTAVGTSADNSTFDYKGDMSFSGFIANPYFRWYTNGALTGFYLEAFARYYNYNFDIPYDYLKNGQTIAENAEGTASAFGGGIGLGTQIEIFPRVVLDMYTGFGMGTGRAHAETSDPNLEPQDFQNIKAEMDGSKDVEVFLVGDAIQNMTYDANENSAWADVTNIPIPILRFGLSIGYMF